MNAEKKQLRQADYLEHMLDAIRLARSYVDGLSREYFLADKKTQQAVVLNIVVIGEAATQLANESPAFVAQAPELPWKQMRGMRNRMAHGTWLFRDLPSYFAPPSSAPVPRRAR